MRKRTNDAAVFSHAEFDALPHSVQRKYFSSLERLRIAEQQHQQHQHERTLFHHDNLPLDSSRRSSRSHHRSISLHRSFALGSVRRHRLIRKVDSLRIEHELAQQEAEFFLSLPPKLRRQYFTPEEQVLLIGRCDHDRPPLPELPVLHQTPQRFRDFQFGFLDDDNDNDESDSSIHRGRRRRRSRSLSPTRISFDSHDQDASRRTVESLIHIDKMSPPLSYQQPPSFRRTLSLTNMPARHSTSSAPPLAEPPLRAFGPTQWHQRSTSVVSRSGRRSSHTPSAPVFDPEATHYQDPEARKKLRMFLGSPQKFDEAVEFGFPSTSGDDTITPRYQLPPITTDARNFSRDMQSFLRDDKISFLEDKDDETVLESDKESLTDLESPVTPSSIGLSFRGHTRHVSPSNFSSLDSSGFPPMHPMQGRLNREMTLRMTLTRPDLRADEEHLYGWQSQKSGKDDPFALEELHLTDDMTGANGAFAVKPKQGNLVSRLFKRASKRGR